MKYYCQHAVKRIVEHMIPIPEKLKVDKKYLFECDEPEFINGLYSLTEIIKRIYEDMIENPKEYALPLIEVSQAECTPKDKRLSANSAKWLVTLLFIMGQAGTVTQNELSIPIMKYRQCNEELKPKDRIKNAGILLSKLQDFGFILDGFNGKSFEKGRDNFILSYPDNVNVIKALRGYMIAATISYELYAMNPYFVLPEKNRNDNQQCINFYNYLQETDKRIFEEFNRLLKEAKYNCRSSASYSYMLEYYENHDSDNYVVRCLSEENRLEIVLRLRNMDRYAKEILSLPMHIQKLFKTTTCKFCNSNGDPNNSMKCHYRIEWTIEDEKYATCSCIYFRIREAEAADLIYYIKLLSLDKQTVHDLK